MGPADRVDTLETRIDESDAIAAADREVLHDFHDRLSILSQEYSDHRHEKLLRHCVLMAERLPDGQLAALEAGQK